MYNYKQKIPKRIFYSKNNKKRKYFQRKEYQFSKPFFRLLFNRCTTLGYFNRTTQIFIQAFLMSGSRYKKLNLLIEFSNSIFIKSYFKANWH